MYLLNPWNSCTISYTYKLYVQYINDYFSHLKASYCTYFTLIHAYYHVLICMCTYMHKGYTCTCTYWSIHIHCKLNNFLKLSTCSCQKPVGLKTCDSKH